MRRDAFDLPADGAASAGVVRWRDGVRSEVADWLAEEVPVAAGIQRHLARGDAGHAVAARGFRAGLRAERGNPGRCLRTLRCRGRRVRSGTHGAHAGVVTGIRRPERQAPQPRRSHRLWRCAAPSAWTRCCGRCGAVAAGHPVPAAAIAAAMRAMRVQQHLNAATGSVHAAAWCDADGTPRVLREDVGRHNALRQARGCPGRGALVGGRRFHRDHQPRQRPRWSRKPPRPVHRCSRPCRRRRAWRRTPRTRPA